MNSDYALHCEAARALAETYFDAEKGMESLLNKAWPRPRSAQKQCSIKRGRGFDCSCEVIGRHRFHALGVRLRRSS